MKRFLILTMCAVAAFGCNSSHKDNTGADTENYAQVTIGTAKTNLINGVSENGLEVLKLYRRAADVVDSIYAKQAFYPADMTDAEFQALEDSAKNSPYTIIRKDENGKLQAVWYHDAYAEEVAKINNFLGAAADITIKPSVAAFLKDKEEALATDNYTKSDITWLETNDSRMDLVIGPYETDDDQVYGIKRSYGAIIALRDAARTEQIKAFTDSLRELQALLPVESDFVPGTQSSVFAGDAVYYAGIYNNGVKKIAINLPYDKDVQTEYGSRTIIFSNVIAEKYNMILNPLANVILTDSQRENTDAEAFFWNIVFREIAHGLGVNAKPLGNASLTIEETKGDVLSVYLNCKMIEQKRIPWMITKEDALTAFVLSTLRSARFGNTEATGRANVIIYNYLVETGAIARNASNEYTIDYAKTEQAVSDLAAKLLGIQTSGDKEAADSFIAKYQEIGQTLKDDFFTMRSADIPTDIDFNFAWE